jgi:integrase/recombinase XerD
MMGDGNEPPVEDRVKLSARQRAVIEAFLDAVWMERGLSVKTLEAYRADLYGLARWLSGRERGLLEVERADLQAFLQWRLEGGVKPRTVARALSTLRHFYRYQVREAFLASDPTARIASPRLARSLPETLTEGEVEALLAAPDIETDLGLRDRAMLELLYACGLRVSELVELCLHQVNLRAGCLRIVGKGDRERLVPLGEEASAWLTDYLRTARTSLLGIDQRVDHVFVTCRKKAMTRQAFWYLVKRYSRSVGIQRPLSPHTLRHAFATHLVNHGANLRVVQLLLGHSNLSTTQIYTHVARQRLKALHAEHHPRG